jgi:hypothetical protein
VARQARFDFLADERAATSLTVAHAIPEFLRHKKSVAIWSDMSTLDMLTESDDEEAAVISRSQQDTEAALRALAAGS